MNCYIIYAFVLITYAFNLSALTKDQCATYQTTVVMSIGEKLPELASYPSFHFPNDGHEAILTRFPEGKVPIFGYGSLMNKTSAARSIKLEAVESMTPVVAFGVKRLFNYNAKDYGRWGDLEKKEKAMLNLHPSFNPAAMANGVVVQVDAEDLAKLVKREEGYDLIPIIIASWEDVKNQNPFPNLRVVYTFVAQNELRDNVLYTTTEHYPVRGYLRAVYKGAKEFDAEFEQMWKDTTYLADGVTALNQWDEETFKGILCTKKPD